MICARHDWWHADICPKCHTLALADLEARCNPPALQVPETVTVAETPETDLVSGHPSAAAETGLEIPDFLLRNKDGTFAHPELMVHDHVLPTVSAANGPAPVERPLGEWADAELYEALEDTQARSLIERQPIYQELRTREDRKKSLTRIAEMKAKKAAKDAPL